MGEILYFDPHTQKKVNERSALEEDIRIAQHREDFKLYFQPQVNADGIPIGAETLIRWFHPTKGFISPLELIEIAEETGLIYELGEWILKEAMSKFKHWNKLHPQFPKHLSINVSAWQFTQTNFVDNYFKILEEFEINPSWIVLELTESSLIQDLQSTIKKLNQIRDKGTQIALDDFGTGYSSLAYVKDLPLDYIKIDKAFVDQMNSTNGTGLVETIISMGKNFKLAVIAEGTETLEQVEMLKSFGCHLFQGYYFSRPLPQKDYEAWVLDKLPQ